MKLPKSLLPLSLTLLSAVLIVPVASAHHGHGAHHGHHHRVVVRPAPARSHYAFHHLPHTASFVVLAGVRYAVIDNYYYRRTGNHYVYVANPPTQVVTPAAPATPPQVVATATPETAAGDLPLGQVVDRLPAGATAVTIEGSTYQVASGQWFLPLADMQHYVVVSAPI